METNILTDWNVNALLPKTIHLIEIDSIASDSVYTHVTLNNEICHAKVDTGAQINMMTESNLLGKSTSCHCTPTQMLNWSVMAIGT